MKKHNHYTLAGWAVALLIVCAGASSGYGQTAPQYEIRDLGAYHGRYIYNVVEKINNPGQIAGVALTRSGEAHPALYSHGRVTDLGLLPGQLHATVADMNDKGEIVGVQSTGGSADPNYVPIAYLVSGGLMINLVELTGVSDLFPTAINTQGQIVGNIGERFTTTGSIPFIYSNGSLTRPPPLVAGGWSLVSDINDAGDIIGTASTGTSLLSYHAVIYSRGQIVDLGTLPGGGNTYGYAINNLGHAIVYSGEQSLFYRNGTMTDLGFHALGLNDSDQVVGLTANAYPADNAVLYSQGVLYDLTSLISHNSGWNLYYANSINNRGEITGFGFYRGQDRSFVLTPINERKRH